MQNAFGLAPIQHLGTRWLGPSYLELSEGPWGTAKEFGANVIASWKKTIDWHADNGLNTIIADIPYARSDAVYIGWGFHYFLDFKNYPHADELFSYDFRKRNLATLNAIFDHAREKGIRCFLHHSNFLAPRRMALASGWAPRYKVYANVGGSASDRMGLIIPNCEWANPDYQTFMEYCWREALRQLPSLTGILGSYAEATSGIYQLGLNGPKDSGPPLEMDGVKLEDNFCSRYHADTRFISNAVDYVQKFTNILKSEGRTPLVRVWGTAWAYDLLPAITDYVVKYQLFDCIDAGPDPLIKRWIEAGHRVWAEAEIFGENAGPILWTSPSYFEKIARDSKALGLQGFVSHVNSYFENGSLDRPSKCLNLELFARSLNGKGTGDLRRHSIDVLKQGFGQDAEIVCEALEKVSVSVLNFSRVIHRVGEGFTFGWPCRVLPVADTSTSSIMLPNSTPPDWCRDGLFTLREYLDFLAVNAYVPGTLNQARGDRQCPVQLMREAAELAATAGKCLQAIADSNPSNVEIQDLVHSARLAEAQSTHIAATMAALLAYYSAKRCLGLSEQKALSGECLERFREARRAQARIREHLCQLSPGHFGSANTQHDLISAMRTAYETFCLESAFYEKECTELLEGATWTLSEFHLNWRSLEFCGPIQITWRKIKAFNLPRLQVYNSAQCSTQGNSAPLNIRASKIEVSE